ncbi:hypothetical protein [Modicisalibacter luteus]|uniref:hypothetical protein n=1 Tax=Modicisalibacter luteus TaxID=453962 RepID=UPI0036319FE9
MSTSTQTRSATHREPRRLHWGGLIKAAFLRLGPRSLARNPVMAVVGIGTLVCALYTGQATAREKASPSPWQ